MDVPKAESLYVEQLRKWLYPAYAVVENPQEIIRGYLQRNGIDAPIKDPASFFEHMGVTPDARLMAIDTAAPETPLVAVPLAVLRAHGALTTAQAYEQLDAASKQATGNAITPEGIERFVRHTVSVAAMRHADNYQVTGAAGFGGSGLPAGLGGVAGYLVGGAVGAPAGPTGIAAGAWFSPNLTAHNIAGVNAAKARCA